MNRRKMIGLSAAAMGGSLLPVRAFAQQKSLKDRLVGAWILASIYDRLADGKDHNVWGAGIMGSLMFSATGRVSLQLIAANRDTSAMKDPRTPIGPAIGYFGTYSMDEAANTFTFHIERSTFPKWDGVDRTATIETLTDSDLIFLNAVVHDPGLGDLVPHQAWKRAV
jgi:Lipocalin-like domain